MKHSGLRVAVLAGLVAFAPFIPAGTAALAKDNQATKAVAGDEGANDSHAGYYYPQPATRETYKARVPVQPAATKKTRAGFTASMNAMQEKRGYAPDFHMFAKGEDAEKLIIVATGNNRYGSLYRLRALLASLTSSARLSPIFEGSPQPEDLTFLDLCRLIGFQRVTVSDGLDIAHRIDIE